MLSERTGRSRTGCRRDPAALEPAGERAVVELHSCTPATTTRNDDDDDDVHSMTSPTTVVCHSHHQPTNCQLAVIPIQSNPIFIVKTQLTERSRITDKYRENRI